MLALIASLVIAAAPIPDKFAGGFIQLNVSTANDPSSRLDRARWRAVLKSMKDAGMTTVILQQLAYRQDGMEFDVLRPGEADDATGAILIEAEGLRMTVFLGLWNAGFSEEDFKHDAFLDDATTRSGKLLKKIQGHPEYLRYNSLGGWYLPIEPWNFKETAGETKRLREHYLIPLSKACKAVADKPVAFSCYFNPVGFATPAETRDVYKEVLKDSRIDILLPQDGVGERANPPAACQEYFKALKQACDRTVKLWAVLECFTLGRDGKRVPCDPARLPSQFVNAHGNADSFVTYDFFHYMNPNRYNWANGQEITTLCIGGPVAARKPLYDGYRMLIAP